MKTLFKSVLSASMILISHAVMADEVDEATIESVRLYTLDCGQIDMNDLGIFSHEGKYDGQTNKAVDTCFLIRHPKGDLLWDTGLPEGLIDMPEGLTNGAFHLQVTKRLTDQLAEVGIAPEDIEYLSVSHSHFDHVGNAGLFAASTFIVNAAEYSHMFSNTMKANTDLFAAYSALEGSEHIMFTDTYDVFGDGSAVIYSMPGHTPGHSSLLVRLENEGNILLSGDMYHFTRARELKTIPAFNSDIEMSKASMKRFEELAARENASVVIQHEKADYEAMPAFPAYLD